MILILLVCGLLYWSHRLNNNVQWYYAAAEPYIEQAMQHGLSMFKHADNSSEALENVMHGAEMMQILLVEYAVAPSKPSVYPCSLFVLPASAASLFVLLYAFFTTSSF